MRQANVVFRDEEAGILIQHDDGSFTFRYLDSWLSNPENPPVSVTFPKNEKEFHAATLFPFFYNLLPEGSNKQIVCAHHRIDTNDDFGLLLTSARYDSIGAVRVVKFEN